MRNHHIITDELFNAVTKYDLLEDSQFWEDRLYYYDSNGQKQFFTLDEFFFKCKHWALTVIVDPIAQRQKSGTIITSWTLSDVMGVAKIIGIDTAFYSDTEQLAVFKASQWVLDHYEMKSKV